MIRVHEEDWRAELYKVLIYFKMVLSGIIASDKGDCKTNIDGLLFCIKQIINN